MTTIVILEGQKKLLAVTTDLLNWISWCRQNLIPLVSPHSRWLILRVWNSQPPNPQIKSNQINFIHIAQNHNHIASMGFTICTVNNILCP